MVWCYPSVMCVSWSCYRISSTSSFLHCSPPISLSLPLSGIWALCGFKREKLYITEFELITCVKRWAALTTWTGAFCATNRATNIYYKPKNECEICLDFSNGKYHNFRDFLETSSSSPYQQKIRVLKSKNLGWYIAVAYSGGKPSLNQLERRMRYSLNRHYIRLFDALFYLSILLSNNYCLYRSIVIRRCRPGDVYIVLVF